MSMVASTTATLCASVLRMACVWSAGLALGAGALDPAPPVSYAVAIDAAAPQSRLPQTLVGVEVETTGHSIVGGGLSSQMLFDGSFEDPKDDSTRPPPTHNRPACDGTCHWSYSAGAATTSTTAFRGTHSVLLQPGARVSSAGLYARGLSFRPGSRYAGYFFAEAGAGTGNAVVTVGLSARCDAAAAAAVGATQRFHLPRPPPPPSSSSSTTGWSMVNFSLSYALNGSTAAGCFHLEASAANTGPVHVDQVFLEHTDGLWRGGAMHLRGDVADALLLTDAASGRAGLGALRFNGGMIGDENYVWQNLRGPAWARNTSCHAGMWSWCTEYPFAMFEALELKERAGVAGAVIGLNVWHETPASARGLVEYLFGDLTTKLGALRASDGHTSPYNASGLIFELGNEESKLDYWQDHAHPILLAMRSEVALLRAAGGQDLSQLRWSIR